MSEERLTALEARLDRLDSIESIRDLQQRYVRGLAARDADAMIALMTPDIVTDITWHGEIHGIDAVGEDMRLIFRNVRQLDGYVLSSPDIQVDGDTATGVWTLHRHVADYPLPHGGFQRVWGVWQECRYRCSYRREAGVWKIARIHFRSVAPDPDHDDKIKAEAARTGGFKTD